MWRPAKKDLYPNDWTNTDQVFAYLDSLVDGDDSFIGGPIGANATFVLGRHLRPGELSTSMAFAWIVKFASEGTDEDERFVRDCMENHLAPRVETQEERVEVMNHPYLFGLLSDYSRRKMYKAVLENGDLSALGVGWTVHFSYMDDVIATNRLVSEHLVRTHSVECIQDMGDTTCTRADELLLVQIQSDSELELDLSCKTAKFIGAARICMSSNTAIHVAVGVASELIVELIGVHLPREKALGIGCRTAHTQLKTVDLLINRIISAMTPENAGIVLRWAMPLKGKHRDFVWNRLYDAVRQNYWRILPIIWIGQEIGVKWPVGNRDMRVISEGGEGQSNIGNLHPGGQAMVPGHHELGTSNGSNTWRQNIHPLDRPTTWMKANPSL